METVESSRRILPALTDGSTEIQHHQVFMDFEDDALPIFLQTTETLQILNSLESEKELGLRPNGPGDERYSFARLFAWRLD